MNSSDLAGILPLLLIVLAFWFLVIRPARKRQQDMNRIQSSVEVGSEVMLGSGIYGKVVSVADETLQLEVAPGTTMKVARQAVVRVIDTSAGEPGTPAPGDGPGVIDEQ
ncbi:MAG: preprotein translocase subunit YajC [Nocardioidaceae bacterium]